MSIQEITERSPMHALGVSIAQQTQQQLERQRRLWQLREKRRSVAEDLASLDQEIAVEENEQERDARLFEFCCERFSAYPVEAPTT